MGDRLNKLSGNLLVPNRVGYITKVESEQREKALEDLEIIHITGGDLGYGWKSAGFGTCYYDSMTLSFIGFMSGHHSEGDFSLLLKSLSQEVVQRKLADMFYEMGLRCGRCKYFRSYTGISFQGDCTYSYIGINKSMSREEKKNISRYNFCSEFKF